MISFVKEFIHKQPVDKTTGKYEEMGTLGHKSTFPKIDFGVLME
jgi:hypothetical protein